MLKIALENIDKEEALRYMGQRSEPGEVLSGLLERCERELLSAAAPVFTYRVFDIRESAEGIEVCGTALVLKGNDIREHLEGCGRAVLMCATLGAAVDALIRKAEITDISAAFAMDALASAAIEQVCRKADEAIRCALPESFFTWRFSPGYGDFPLDTQRDLLNVLNAQRLIGLCLENSNILIPRKSVTAVAGVSDRELPPKKRGCVCCNMAAVCNFRKRGGHCGF